jgi:hypothetical protein
MCNMTKTNTTHSPVKPISLDTIHRHQAILKKRGIKALGREASGTAINTSITAIKVISYLTVIFAIPVYLLTSLYYKTVGRRVIEQDNIAMIRNNHLFNMTTEEKDFLKKSNLLVRGKFLDDTQKTFGTIHEAHHVYDLAKEFSSKKSSSPLVAYLKRSQISGKGQSQIKQLSDKITKNQYNYQKIPDWFKNISTVNATLKRLTSTEEDKNTAYELLDLLSNCGKDLLAFDIKKIEQFELCANTYLQIINQGSDPTKAKLATTLLLPLILQLYNSDARDVAKAFANAFVEHSYLRDEIADNQYEFIIKFNEDIKNHLSELKSEEDIQQAIKAFQSHFNHPEHLDLDLAEHFGEDNAQLVKGILLQQDPSVASGAKAFNQSKLAEKPFHEQIRVLVPEIAKEVGLSDAVVKKVLITEDLTRETFVIKKNVLVDLKKRFIEIEDLELIQECFINSSEGFLANLNDNDYISDWKKAIAYANRHFSRPEYSPSSIAKAYGTVIESLTEKNHGNHKTAIEHLGHACDTYAFMNRDRREEIRIELDTELTLFTLQEKLKLVDAKQVANTVAEHYGIDKRIIQSYLHSPIEDDFVQQLRTLKKLSDCLPELQKTIKTPSLLNTFIRAYGPDKFTRDITSAATSSKLTRILSHGNDMSKKGVYQSNVIAKALEQTLTGLEVDSRMTSEEAIEALYQAATSFKDNERDEMVKVRLQENLLQIEILKRVKLHAKTENYEITADTKSLVLQLLENFIVHKDLPKSKSIDYITTAVMSTLDLHFNGEATDAAIALSFASNGLLKSELSALDKIGNPPFTQSAQKVVKDEALKLNRMEESLTIDQEKLLFPLFFQLLPGFCKEIIPEERKDLQKEVQSKLNSIQKSFDKSEILKLELKKAYSHIGLVYTWLNLGPDMLSPFIETAMNIVISELQKAQQSIRELDDEQVNSQTLEEVLSTNKSTVAMKTFLPLAAEALTSLHEKHSEILAIKKNKVTPIIVTEGSEEEQELNDYTNVVVLTPLEATLMEIFTKIPDSKSNRIKLINKAPGFLNASGVIGNWLARKIGKTLINKQLNESLGIDAHHVKFMKSNIENLISITLTLLPYLMKRHNINGHLQKIRAIKSITLSEGEIDQKELNLKLLEFLENIVNDLKAYQPIIIRSIAHIHQNISESP